MKTKKFKNPVINWIDQLLQIFQRHEKPYHPERHYMRGKKPKR